MSGPDISPDVGRGYSPEESSSSCAGKARQAFENTVAIGMLTAVSGAHFSSAVAAAFKGAANDASKASEVLGEIGSALWFIDLFNAGYWWVNGQHESWFHTAGKVADTARQFVDGIQFIGVDLETVCCSVGSIPVLGTFLASLRIIGSTCSMIHVGRKLWGVHVAQKELSELADLKANDDEEALETRVSELAQKYFKDNSNEETVEPQSLDLRVKKLEKFLQAKVDKAEDYWISIIDDINTLALGILMLTAMFCTGLNGAPTNLLAFYVYGVMLINLVYTLAKPKHKEEVDVPTAVPQLS